MEARPWLEGWKCWGPWTLCGHLLPRHSAETNKSVNVHSDQGFCGKYCGIFQRHRLHLSFLRWHPWGVSRKCVGRTKATLITKEEIKSCRWWQLEPNWAIPSSWVWWRLSTTEIVKESEMAQRLPAEKTGYSQNLFYWFSFTRSFCDTSVEARDRHFRCTWDTCPGIVNSAFENLYLFCPPPPRLFEKKSLGAGTFIPVHHLFKLSLQDCVHIVLT